MRSMLICLLLLALAAPLHGQVVEKIADPCDQLTWGLSPWNSAAGTVTLSDEAAPDAAPGGSILLETHYRGEGFEHFSADLLSDLYIPGRCSRITLRVKRDSGKYGTKVTLLDGWGLTHEWAPKLTKTGEWMTLSYDIPADWAQPIGLRGITTHNWEAREAKAVSRIWIDQVEVQTDIADVDAATGKLRGWTADPAPKGPHKPRTEAPATPLVSAIVTTGRVGNVFAGEAPSLALSVQNCKPGKLSGKLTAVLKDNDGQTLNTDARDVAVDSVAGMTLPVAVSRFGRYVVDATVSFDDGTTVRKSLALAHLPKPRQLTKQQRFDSPYGVNFHSGGDAQVEPFRAAGLVWFREYAFNLDWLRRARGADNRYTAWPSYPKIIGRYEKLGALVLPCLMQAIVEPTFAADGSVERHGPTAAWARDVAHVLATFPQFAYWELDNEYDLSRNAAETESKIDWANYGAFHDQLGKLVDAIGAGTMQAVENGRAGIWPQRVKQQIDSGAFDRIAVVNSHHYCGVEAPEENVSNFNTGFDGVNAKPAALYFDDLRETSRIADSDGKDRQHWITEFGWDTKAGRVVSLTEQAVYLQRSWMLQMAAGLEKSFWFYHYDSAEANNFFDGCGLLTFDKQPKLSLCAMAGLTQILPSPRYVGSASAGEGTHGYVFEQDGKFVASLWTIADTQGPTVSFDAERLYDYLANPLDAKRVALTAAPVFAVGLSPSDPIYLQTAYEIDTEHLARTSAGDAFEAVIRVTGNRKDTVAATIAPLLPPGWTSQPAQADVLVAPGEAANAVFAITPAYAETPGLVEMRFTAAESGKVVRWLRQRVLVRHAVTLAAERLTGEPGDAEVKVTVRNLSAKPRSGSMALAVPDTWNAATPRVEVADLKPGEARDVAMKLRWAGDWPAQQQASVSFTFDGDRTVAAAIIPSAYALHSASNVAIDGDLGDWTEAHAIPAWMLGVTEGAAGAKVYLGWTPQGIALGVEVDDSKLINASPNTFWVGDVMELWISGEAPVKDRPWQVGDHQFWLVPLPRENRVYVGQWKRADEIAETRHDIEGIASAARHSGSGYVMELLIPVKELRNTPLSAGRSIGLNVNLTVRGAQHPREVYWPLPKRDDLAKLLPRWGRMRLID